MIDLLIVSAFVIYSVVTGLRLRKKASEGLDSYFLAGRSLKGWRSGVSMAATQYAADTPLLVCGLVATAGIFSLWRLWIYALAFLMMGFVFGPMWRRTGVLTDAEFTELRYSGKAAQILRALKAIHLGTFVNCTVLAMVLIAAARITEPFLLWNDWLPSSLFRPLADFFQSFQWSLTSLPNSHPEVWIRSANNFISILCIVSFTALYSMTGGLRSVVSTDIVQFSIAMIATLLYAGIILFEVGGFGALGDKLIHLYGVSKTQEILSFGPQDFSSVTLVVLSVIGVQWFAQVNSDGTSYLAQRIMACQTDRDTRIAGLTFTAAQVLLRSLLWLPIVVGLLVIYPIANFSMGAASESFRVAREESFVLGISDLMPVGARGLMLTGMLAALASTLDTHFNWGASYWTNDLYKRFIAKSLFKREAHSRELVWIARLSNIGILVIALGIMSQLSSIQTAWHITLLFGSGLGVVLILRWVWHRINIWSEIAAVGSSIILAPFLLFVFPEMKEGARLLWMTLGSTLIVLAVTFCTDPEPKEVLKEFYRRVRPCGFWGETAAFFEVSAQEPVKRFNKSFLATILCALSIFSLLVGLGRLMFFGILNPWISLVWVSAGLLLIPHWWKRGFNESN